MICSDMICFLVSSKCLLLFETFIIFWSNFPGGRDQDIQRGVKSDLFESGRLADISLPHIWLLQLNPYLTIVNLCINQGLDFYYANLVSTSNIMQTYSVSHELFFKKSYCHKNCNYQARPPFG